MLATCERPGCKNPTRRRRAMHSPGPSRRKERHFGLHGPSAARARLNERGVARAAAGSPTQVGGSSRGPNKVT